MIKSTSAFKRGRVIYYPPRNSYYLVIGIGRAKVSSVLSWIPSVTYISLFPFRMYTRDIGLFHKFESSSIRKWIGSKF